MAKTWLDEFKSAWNNYPSQDNEGYQPERGSFKAGFYSAWTIQEEKLKIANTRLALVLALLADIFRLSPKRGAFGLYYHFNTVNQLKARVRDVVDSGLLGKDQ